VFDDIEDADNKASISSQFGPGIAVNLGTALIMLAERAILRLATKGVDYHTVTRISDLINSLYTTACIGQHLDMSTQLGTIISEDTYFRIIEMKSAFAIQCACVTGALVAEADQKLADTFADFGKNLGITAQIANDILGIIETKDIMKHKVTLPVIYAMSHIDGENLHQLDLIFKKQTSSVEPDKIKSILFNCGAIHYATVKMELFKQLAGDILSGIESGGINTKRIKLFLE
jgi:octaprenyl-diphosphate synthase